MTNDGRGKFALSGWKEKKAVAPGGNKNRFQLENPASTDEEIPQEIRAVSINSSLQGITHTYSPLHIATLHSLGSPTSIRLVKLAGQGQWHVHDNTDEIFILLRGAINMHYRSGSGEEKVARVIGGELLCVPMRMEHCVVADEGTEVLLLEGNDVLHVHGLTDYRLSKLRCEIVFGRFWLVWWHYYGVGGFILFFGALVFRILRVKS